MRVSDACTRRRSGRLLRLVLALAVSATAVGAVPAVAAPASFTWSGADIAEPGPNWSDAANWARGVAPADSSTVGAVTFPALTSADCTSATPVGTCYVSHNDRANLTVGHLDINVSGGGGGYAISGNAITLDDGLTAEQGTNWFGTADLTLPITLGATQTWNVDSALDLGSYGLGTALSGNHALTVNIANGHQFWIYGPIETGAVTINGGQVALASDLNSTSRNPVTLTHSTLLQYGFGSVGSLSTFGSTILLGLPAGGVGPKSLRARSVKLDSRSKLALSAGSELTSTGSIDLGGARLGLTGQYHSPCSSAAGTLVSTKGKLTGTFRNAPPGGKYFDGCTYYRIHYKRTGSPKTVTATLLATPARSSRRAS